MTSEQREHNMEIRDAGVYSQSQTKKNHMATRLQAPGAAKMAKIMSLYDQKNKTNKKNSNGRQYIYKKKKMTC